MIKLNQVVAFLSTTVASAIFSIAAVFIGFGSSPHFSKYSTAERFTNGHFGLMIMAATVLLIMFLPARRTKISKPQILFWAFAVAVAFPFAVTKIIFGTNELEAILIFFRDNQANDIATIGADSFKTPISSSLIVLGFLILTTYYLVGRKQWLETCLMVGGLALFVVSPITLFLKNSVTTNHVQAAFDFKNEIGLKVTDRPDEKKNLIVVYLESMERTYRDLDVTKAVFEPLKVRADQGIEATNVRQTVGTEFTIAGIVATQCGVPLVPEGLSSIFFRKKSVEDQMGAHERPFLPKITCMGDILAEDGYELSYINGASLNRFSKRSFFQTHGFDRVYGLDEAPAERIKGRTNSFGMNDALLFEMIYEEYDRLVAVDKPYAFSFLSLSTHGPDSFLDNDCAFDDSDSKLPEAMECTLKLLEDFLAYVDANGNGRETQIVIMSDHLAMSNTLNKHLRTSPVPRRNLFIMQGPHGTGVLERDATAMDIYPTMMEQMGYKFANGRANLGRSMFTPDENLFERFGGEDLEKLLKGNHDLANYIWREDDTQLAAN
jgi:phosphoglycerol transferase